jgi:hypothetical protein
MGTCGVAGAFAARYVAPSSVPASQPRSSTVSESIQRSFARNGRSATPTNQSGLGAIIATSVTSGCVAEMSKSSATSPGEGPMPSPDSSYWLAPAAFAAATSPSSGVLEPSSAMAWMPGEASWPGRQSTTRSEWVAPISPEKCAPGGKPVGWVDGLQVAWNVTV